MAISLVFYESTKRNPSETDSLAFMALAIWRYKKMGIFPRLDARYGHI